MVVIQNLDFFRHKNYQIVTLMIHMLHHVNNHQVIWYMIIQIEFSKFIELKNFRLFRLKLMHENSLILNRISNHIRIFQEFKTGDFSIFSFINFDIFHTPDTLIIFIILLFVLVFLDFVIRVLSMDVPRAMLLLHAEVLARKVAAVPFVVYWRWPTVTLGATVVGVVVIFSRSAAWSPLVMSPTMLRRSGILTPYWWSLLTWILSIPLVRSVIKITSDILRSLRCISLPSTKSSLRQLNLLRFRIYRVFQTRLF